MIVTMQFLLTSALGLLRFRWGLSTFVFFLAFSPRSIGLSLNSGSAVLTFARVAFPLVVLIFVVSRVFERGKNRQAGNYYMGEPVFKALALFSLLELLSSLVNGVSPVYALDSILATLVAFALFFDVSSERMFDSLLRAFMIATLVTVVIVFFEFPLATPLHYAFADQSFFEEGGLRIRERGGFYRVQGIFDNPLGLAEYIVYMLPIAGYKLVTERGRLRYILVIFMLFAVILATGSRSGILAFIASGLMFWMSYNWYKMSKYSRVLLSGVIFTIFIFGLFWGFGLVLALGERAQNVTFYLLDDSERSSLGRALQYLDVYSTMLEHPFFGFGVLQNFAVQLEQISRIDNYILRTGLEAGFPGMGAFIFMLITVFLRGSKIHKNSTKPRERGLRAFVLSLLMGFTLMKLFVSIPLNNIIFFTLLGLALGLYAKQRKKADAHPSGT